MARDSPSRAGFIFVKPATRFAPSPTGALHLGHAFSAIVGYDLARASGGRFLLRIEDIDGARSRPELAASQRVTKSMPQAAS